MAPTVTYDGVEGAEGGTIFKDVKFWVAQRVPQRSQWLELIKVCPHLPLLLAH
jgi:hypothetical protein